MLAVDIDGLVERFRSEVDDAVSGDGTDALWSPTDVLSYATEAADAVARATLRLYEIIDIAVTSGTSYVALPARVLHIRSAVLVTAEKKLGIENLNEQHQSDLFDSTGTPNYVVADYRSASLELFPAPTANDTLRLQCSVTISEALDGAADVPFTDVAEQRLMLTYMKYLAYLKHDAETLDIQRSNQYRQEFERDAMRRKAQLNSYRRRPGTVRMNW